MARFVVVVLAGMILVVGCSSSAPNSSASPLTTTTQLPLYRDALLAALHDTQSCLATPSGTCDDAAKRLQTQLDATDAPLAGLETRSTIPLHTILELKAATSRLSFVMDLVRTCSHDRTAPICAAQLAAVNSDLDEVTAAVQGWPGPTIPN